MPSTRGRPPGSRWSRPGRADGIPCLDFVNAALWSPRSPFNDSADTASELDALIDWLRDQALLESHPRRTAPPATKDAVESVARLLNDARRVHTVLLATLTTLAGRNPLSDPELDAFNSILSRSASHFRLSSVGSGLVWRATFGEAVARALASVSWSALELVTHADLSTRIRLCDGCGRVFLDRTKNRSRRWCDMSGCGNRAKARRHYARRRSEANRPSQADGAE